MPDAPSLLTGGQGRGFPYVDEPSGQFNGVAAAREGDSDHGDGPLRRREAVLRAGAGRAHSILTGT